MNKWRILRYVFFLGSMTQVLVQSLVFTSEVETKTILELNNFWGLGMLALASIISYLFAQALPSITAGFIVKSGMATKPWKIPNVKTRFFTLTDPAQPLHAFIYMLSGGVCGLLLSFVIKRNADDLITAILLLACQLGLLAGIKKLRVTFKEKYTTGQA